MLTQAVLTRSHRRCGIQVTMLVSTDVEITCRGLTCKGLGLQEYYKKMFGMKRLRYRDQPDVSCMCSGRAAARLH